MDGFLSQLRFPRKYIEFFIRLDRRERTVYIRNGKRYAQCNEHVVYETFNGQSADVRGRKNYWSGEAVKRVTGYEIEGKSKEADGFIYLINSDACCVDACGEVKDKNGNAVMKKWWEVTEKDVDTMMNATTWPYADLGYFRVADKTDYKELFYKMLDEYGKGDYWVAARKN